MRCNLPPSSSGQGEGRVLRLRNGEKQNDKRTNLLIPAIRPYRNQLLSDCRHLITRMAIPSHEGPTDLIRAVCPQPGKSYSYLKLSLLDNEIPELSSDGGGI